MNICVCCETYEARIGLNYCPACGACSEMAKNGPGRQVRGRRRRKRRRQWAYAALKSRGQGWGIRGRWNRLAFLGRGDRGNGSRQEGGGRCGRGSQSAPARRWVAEGGRRLSAATAFITGEGSVTGGVAAAIAARLGWEARLAMENTAAATRRLFARATGWACYASPAFSGRYRAGFGLAALSRGFRACRAIARVSGLPRYRAGFGLAALSRGFRACRAIARVSGLPPDGER